MIGPWGPMVILRSRPFTRLITRYTFRPVGQTLTPKPRSSSSQWMVSVEPGAIWSTVRFVNLGIEPSIAALVTFNLKVRAGNT